MKKKLLITLFLVGSFTFTALSQTGTQTQPNPSNNQTEPKKKVILSFKDTDKMFQLLKGKWAFMERDCTKGFTIKVPTDRKTIKLIYPKSEDEEEREYIFNVSEVGRYYIRGQYEGEERLTDDGHPVGWDFMFTSADEFVWHRTDWAGLNATPPVTRCKEEKSKSNKLMFFEK